MSRKKETKTRKYTRIAALILVCGAMTALVASRVSGKAEPEPVLPIVETPVPTPITDGPDEEENTAGEALAPTATPEPTPQPTPTPEPNSPAGRAAALGLPTPPEIDVNSWEYILVNTAHPLSQDFVPPELTVLTTSRCPVDARIADQLLAFAQGCRDAGNPVLLSSGYRSYAEQTRLFNYKLNETGSREKAAKIVLPPGTSEHQTGLACDMTDRFHSPKVPEELSTTATFQWLNAHCAEYGFILRYPQNKEDITGVIYEPWEFRYVGEEAAAYIQENDLCLEEFLALYGVN